MNSLSNKNNQATKPVMFHTKAKPFVQAKLTVNEPGNMYEQEADAMADLVMRMSSNETVKPVTGLIGKSLQRKCAHCEEEERKRKPVMRKAEAGNTGMFVSSSFASSLNASKGNGSSLPQGARSFMENAFSADFSGVKIHTGAPASEMSKRINAKAFTYGNDIYFEDGQYSPNTYSGKRLLVHELTHTLQQSSGTEATTSLQRDMNDGHDLLSPRFSGDQVLENCFDGKGYLQFGSSGPAVEKIQQALIDAGFPLLRYGVDGIFGLETQTAIRNYQGEWGVIAIDGIVGPETMGALDAEFSEIGPTPSPAPLPLVTAKVCSRPLMGTNGPFNHAYIDAPPYRYSIIHPFCPFRWDDGVSTRTTAQKWEHSCDPCGQSPSCVPCHPAQGVTDVNACLRDEFNSYPALSFYNALGPNSNTFAGVLARRCCAGMAVKPAALGTVPGWNYPPAKYRPGICPTGGPNCHP